MITTVQISIVFDGDAATTSAAITDLLARLENPNLVMNGSAVEQPEPKPARKPRRKRQLTDEQRAEIRERLAAGKAMKAAEREAAQKAQESKDENTADKARKTASSARKSANAAKTKAAAE